MAASKCTVFCTTCQQKPLTYDSDLLPEKEEEIVWAPR
jgi:hypothetical protein